VFVLMTTRWIEIVFRCKKVRTFYKADSF